MYHTSMRKDTLIYKWKQRRVHQYKKNIIWISLNPSSEKIYIWIWRVNKSKQYYLFIYES